MVVNRVLASAKSRYRFLVSKVLQKVPILSISSTRPECENEVFWLYLGRLCAEWLHSWYLVHSWGVCRYVKGVLGKKVDLVFFWGHIRCQNMAKMAFWHPKQEKTRFFGNFSAVYVRNDFILGN
jgi:hypothetical protein